MTSADFCVFNNTLQYWLLLSERITQTAPGTTRFLAAAHSFTQDNPHLIDNLMTDALTISSQQDKKVIDVEIIRAAVDNQGLY